MVGREFSCELLAAVANLDNEQLTRALDQLVSSELVFRHGTPAQPIYSFRHALVQEAAYQSLLKIRRQELHARIARVLEQDHPEVTATEPELLAYHFTQADLTDKAIRYWHVAGERAIERSANAEAIGHLTKCFELLNSLPESSEIRRQELNLLAMLGPALIATKGLTDAEVEKTYLRARELCREIGQTSQHFQVLIGLWRFHLTRGKLHTARVLSEECHALADRLEDQEALIASYQALGAPRTTWGNLFQRGPT